MNIVMAKHSWEWIVTSGLGIVVEIKGTIGRFRNQGLKILFETIKQESLLNSFSNSEISSVLLGVFQSESLLHRLDINFELSGLFTNNCIDEKIFLLKWAHFVDGNVSRIVEIEVVNDLGVALLDAHVSHFP
jgi:hypothetical protein